MLLFWTKVLPYSLPDWQRGIVFAACFWPQLRRFLLKSFGSCPEFFGKKLPCPGFLGLRLVFGKRSTFNLSQAEKNKLKERSN
jgi:hypothetical protein